MNVHRRYDVLLRHALQYLVLSYCNPNRAIHPLFVGGNYFLFGLVLRIHNSLLLIWRRQLRLR